MPSYHFYAGVKSNLTNQSRNVHVLTNVLTECYLRAEELSPSYPCYVRMAEGIFLL